jgi:hypothetical protein
VSIKVIPNNKKSQRDAVKCAKDINTHNLPAKMLNNGEYICLDLLPEAFANHFKSKVENIVN